MTDPLHILLIEDDELFRLGLSVRLQQEPGLTIGADVSDGETGLELASRSLFDLVLLDVGLPGIGGIETCRLLKLHHPDLPILILTSHSENRLIARLIAAGANGYCLKGGSTASIILALRSVAAGASWWDPKATAEIREAFHPLETAELPQDTVVKAPDPPLTKREQDILALIAAGKSNQEIAVALYITTGTVRVHVHAILQKLEVRDRTQAAILALQNHWI